MYTSADCAESGLVREKSNLLDYCYSHYNGTHYASGMGSTPYLYTFNGANCDPPQIQSTTYVSTGSCNLIGKGQYLMITTSGSNSNSDNGSSGVSDTILALGVIFSFVGGALITVIAIYCTSRKPATLASKGESFNNNI